MNKNRVSHVLGFTLLLVSLFVLVGFQSALAAPLNLDSDAEVDSDTARWVALGEAYKKLDEVNQRRAEAENARWVAMGEAYLSAAQTEPVAGVVDLNYVDPADRKFYTQAWLADGASSEGLDPLAGVDPADRKFYIDGYVPILAAVEQLSTITQALAIAD